MKPNPNILTELSAPQKRKHAELIRKNDPGLTPDEQDEARAFADYLDARADLDDAKNGETTGIAESAAYTIDYPILGRVTIEGGDWTEIENPWTEDHDAEAKKRGVMVCFERCRSKHGDQSGQITRIYIGSKTHGPMAQWDASRLWDNESHGAAWSAITSKGNFGKNWACGGNWADKYLMTDKPDNCITIRMSALFHTLADCRPEMEKTIKEIRDAVEVKGNAIAIAEAKVAAAKKRILAASQRSMAYRHMEQAGRPIYEGQSGICYDKAAKAEAFAEKSEAEAELILARAGVPV